MNECRLCGAPGGYPYCNADCRSAAPGEDVPTYDPPETPPPATNPSTECPF